MNIRFEPMDTERAAQISNWKYSRELSFYNGDGETSELMNGTYWAAYLVDELIGFCCHGESAQIPGYDYGSQAVDMGLGLSPTHVRCGMGRFFIKACMQKITRDHPHRPLRLTVAEFNGVAIRLYAESGFEAVDRLVTSEGIAFYVMEKRMEEKMYDITKPLEQGMQVYSGHEQFHKTQTRTVANDRYNLTHFSMGAHCGTHVDAPAHFIENAETVENMPLELLVGAALVITAKDGQGYGQVPHGTRRIVLKSDGYSGLTLEEADELIAKGVQLIGTERLSVALDGHDAVVHRKLLSNGVWIVENLALDGVLDGWYELICLPLKLVGCEGAPARVLLKPR